VVSMQTNKFHLIFFYYIAVNFVHKLLPSP
jgi:hypothetical protein